MAMRTIENTAPMIAITRMPYSSSTEEKELQSSSLLHFSEISHNKNDRIIIEEAFFIINTSSFYVQ